MRWWRAPRCWYLPQSTGSAFFLTVSQFHWYSTTSFYSIIVSVEQYFEDRSFLVGLHVSRTAGFFSAEVKSTDTYVRTHTCPWGNLMDGKGKMAIHEATQARTTRCTHADTQLRWNADAKQKEKNWTQMLIQMWKNLFFFQTFMNAFSFTTGRFWSMLHEQNSGQ